MTLSQVLHKILSNYKSIYDAAQEISLQTGEKLDTVHHRLSKWCKKDPETWVKINQALNLLGYEIQIKKRDISMKGFFVDESNLSGKPDLFQVMNGKSRRLTFEGEKRQEIAPWQQEFFQDGVSHAHPDFLLEFVPEEFKDRF
jgi:hypothetical protein